MRGAKRVKYESGDFPPRPLQTFYLLHADSNFTDNDPSTYPCTRGEADERDLHGDRRQLLRPPAT